MLDKPEQNSSYQEKGKEMSVASDIETFDRRPRKIKIKLDSDGFPRAVAFFDVDKTLAECGFIHGEAFKKLFAEIYPDQDPDKLTEQYLNGLHLGTTFRVFHRMIGIARDGRKEWEDPEKYLEWFLGHEKEVDKEGDDHDLAAALSIRHSQMGAEMVKNMDPQILEQTKIKPVFHLVKIYQRMGIPMCVMTANDEPFAKAVCKLLGLGDSFIALACQKDFVGQGKEGAIEYLIQRLEEKGVPIPRKLIVVGDSLNGDISSGAKFVQKHPEYSVNGVLVSENDVEKTKYRIEKDPNLKNIPVEILKPSAIGQGSLARYRRDEETKPRF
ncbi:MAG: HAD family hydrolase [Candidatus Moranbacteria bacterium]|nr:HAD family hydrolase [Candidatus Moranbacteria bacterium]